MRDLEMRDFAILVNLKALPKGLSTGKVDFQNAERNYREWESYCFVVAVLGVCSALVVSGKFFLSRNDLSDNHYQGLEFIMPAGIFLLSYVMRFFNSIRKPECLRDLNLWVDMFFDPIPNNHLNFVELADLADEKMIEYAKVVLDLEKQEKATRSGKTEENEKRMRKLEEARKKFQEAWALYDKFGLLSEFKKEKGYAYFYDLATEKE